MSNGANGTVVIGGGTMGIGIAAAFVSIGDRVTLVEPDGPRRAEAGSKVLTILQGAEKRGKLHGSSSELTGRNLLVSASVEAVEHATTVVIEAVPERLELKGQVLREAETLRPAVLASNTSSLSISRLGELLSEPESLVGLHFFNPVAAMALVEVVKGRRTAPRTLEAAVEIVHRLGKEPIVVNDAPGFASSRLGLALGLEAIRMVEEEVAKPDAIDRAMELGYRHPMGPLRLTDVVGLDVRLDIAKHLERELGPRFTPPRLLEQMVADGQLGRKSGQGFYRWD